MTDSDVIRERWLRGRLCYKEHGGQNVIRAAFDRSNFGNLFLGECSRQFGKTIFEAILALEMAFSKKKAKVKIGTAFQTDLLEFIIPAFEIVMGDCPEDIRPIWKSQKSKYILPHNGSEIKLVGLDRKPNGLRGTVIDLIILSEAGFISNLHYLFKSVIIPATTHRPDCRVVMLSTPPSTPAHEFIDYVEKAQYEGCYVKLTIYDNPMLTQRDIIRLMKESGGAHSTTWRREYLCEHVTDANLAIVSDWKDEYVKELPRDQYYAYYHKYVNMDLGVSDNTAALFGYYDHLKAQYIIEDDFIINGSLMNTKVLQAHLKHREMKNWTEGYSFRIQDEERIQDKEIEAIELNYAQKRPKVLLRVSDNNNPLLLQDLSLLHQIHFIATDKGRLVEMVNEVKNHVRAGSIIVHPQCKQTHGCLKYGVWDKNREKFSHSKVYGHFDALAALVYGVRNLDKVTNPIPRDFHLDKDNEILLSYGKDTSSVGILKGAFGFRR